MKKLFIILLFIFSTTARAFQCSPENPYHSENVVSICHTTHQSYFDVGIRLPVMVHYEITPEHELSCSIRTGSFKPDQSVVENLQATAKDYLGSGYDIGHMYPAEDALFDDQAEHETFTFTNAVPQAPSFNRGKWKSLEVRIRDWSIARHTTLDVYTGPIKNHDVDSLGRVPVPGEFYKIVVDKMTNEAIVFRMTAPRADELHWHGKLSDADIVTELKEVPIDLHQWKLLKTMWLKPKHAGKSCKK